MKTQILAALTFTAIAGIAHAQFSAGVQQPWSHADQITWEVPDSLFSHRDEITWPTGEMPIF